MKQTLYIFTLIVLFSCSNKKQTENKPDNESFKTEINEIDLAKKDEFKQESSESKNENNINDFQKQTLANEFKNAILYKLKDTITADFDGDGNMEKAFFAKENEASGIIIKQALTNSEIRIGFGNQFAHLKDFDWVDFWGLVIDSTTYEILFNETDIIGDTIIRLENPSLVLRKDEVGGGMITFKNGEYKWIHQSD